VEAPYPRAPHFDVVFQHFKTPWPGSGRTGSNHPAPGSLGQVGCRGSPAGLIFANRPAEHEEPTEHEKGAGHLRAVGGTALVSGVTHVRSECLRYSTSRPVDDSARV
jgi:hypothetical protein